MRAGQAMDERPALRVQEWRKMHTRFDTTKVYSEVQNLCEMFVKQMLK
jgi:hypothetical protein